MVFILIKTEPQKYNMKFYYKDITLEVPDSVYFPEEDSELMAEAIESVEIKGKKVLEIGCGSGFLSILMSSLGAVVDAVDKNPKAIETAKQNSKSKDIRFFHSDLFSNIRGWYDIIVFNPPYLPDDSTDIRYSGGPSGRETIIKFVKDARKFLTKNGFILLLISSLTDEKEVLDLFKIYDFKTEIIKRKKIQWEELIVIKAMV